MRFLLEFFRAVMLVCAGCTIYAAAIIAHDFVLTHGIYWQLVYCSFIVYWVAWAGKRIVIGVLKEKEIRSAVRAAMREDAGE